MSDSLSIERIVAGGDGLARHPDGFVVFVPRTAPGDVVEVEYTERHRQWRRGRVRHVVRPGADRTEPPCPYYAPCGGCQLQHLHYEAQLAAKGAIVADCLRRLGGIELSTIEVEPSPRQFAYRNRVSFVAKATEAGLVAGYHALDNPDELVDVSACPLAEDAINAAWASVRETLRAAPLPGTKREVRLTLRASADGRVGLSIEGDTGELAARLAATPGVEAVWRPGDAEPDAAGPTLLSEQWAGHEIPLAGNVFLQVNREAAARLDAYVIKQCGDIAGRQVVDAYCGFGLRALAIARAGAVVTGIDIDRHSIETAAKLASTIGLGAAFIAAPAERALPRQLPADVVVLNPPRRGVDRRVIDALVRRPPRLLIYVSCNPATLARDLKGLAGRLDVSACRAFDLFPQTAHVETVATLTAAGADS